ncbi:hypothetical protein CI238_08787 [Colletotrichum incanum]|uniref:Uncharacterized protein n=1 Tax=Colletotrichum incanum TaxID=1573173 RepID=A0A161VRY2_COLIC|nr:hypothetical protein CI238_08787 [Colletotrichum incanum]
MEEEAASETRQLRRSTLSHQPGQYEESQVCGVQIPSWVHPNPVFDHSLPRHCSFPSVPLDQPGRADAYVGARERGEIDEKKNGSNYSDSDEEDWWAPKSDKNENEDNIMEGSISMAHDLAESGLKRGESFDEYLLSVTNRMDWGSPEPEDVGQPIKWCQIAPSGQWIILLILCRYQAFAAATRLLRMTTLDVINFLALYIQHHRETKQWAKEVNEAPVAVVLQRVGEFWLGIGEMNVLKRPYLPTDTFFDAEREQAIRYLHQVGQDKLVEDVTGWRGLSTDFHTLPIEPEIMAGCIMMLDKGKGSLSASKNQLPQNEQPLLWLGRVPSKCQDLEKCLAELQAYLPRPCPAIASRSESTPKGKSEGLEGKKHHQGAAGDTISSSADESNKTDINAQHNALPGPDPEPARPNCGHGFAQDQSSVIESSQHSPLTIDYCQMDELYNPQLLPRQRVLPVDIIGYPEFNAQGSCEDIQEQGSMQEPRLLFPELEVPTIRICEASPQAQSDCTTSGQISADRMLPPVPFHHSPVRLPEPNLGRDSSLFHQALAVDMGGYGHTSTFHDMDAAAPPVFPFNSQEVNPRDFAQLHPPGTSFTTAPYSPAPNLTSFNNMSPPGGSGSFYTPIDVQARDISMVHQDRNRADSQLNLSFAPNFANPIAVQEPLFQGNSSEASNHLSETITGQTMVPLVAALKSTTAKTSTPDFPQQQENTSTSSILTVDDLESLATLSSRKPSRKQKIDDSDGEYQPRPKRPLNSNARKSTSRSKSGTSLRPTLPQPDPQPQPTIQSQTGTAVTLQPVTRGRGRPRKNPRPRDLAAQPARAQLASANDTDTQVPAATSSDTSDGHRSASPYYLSIGTEAGVQAFTGSPTAALTSTARSTSGRTSTHPSPQSSFQTIRSYNVPHATIPESSLPQTRIQTGRGEQRRPHPSSYEEFWSNHQNLIEAARQGHRGDCAIQNDAATSFVPMGAEMTSSAEAVLHSASSQMRSDIRQTPQGTTHCASGTQQKPRTYTDSILTPARSNMH